MRLFGELVFSDHNINEAIKSFKHKEKGDGKRGPFYNGKIQEPWKFDVENNELFERAVWQGYLDASRTFSDIKDTKKNNEAFNNLASFIRDFFRDEIVFNHEEWCKNFIKDTKKFNSYEPRYGQAQKVVNMAFKYLYCCDGADKYKAKFEQCHMPLDQYTLLWLFIETGTWYREWSWFNEEQYNEVEDKIKEILKKNILGKELVIWQCISDKKIINLKDINEKA